MEEIREQNQLVQTVLTALARDRKRTALRGVVALLTVFVVGRAFLSGRGAPSQASASPVTGAGQLTAGDNGAAGAAEDRELKARVRRNQYIQHMDGSITRDLFRPNLEYFPRVNKTEPARPAATATTAPAQDDQEQERRMVQADAQTLSLESITMVGDSAIASINGKILRVGEWLSGFEIIKITAQNCTVRKKGIGVVLELKK
jgi:Mg-chelatase subunit ChlI